MGFWKSLFISSTIERLAKDFADGKEDIVLEEISSITKDLSLSAVKRSVRIYIKNGTGWEQDELSHYRMNVVLRVCIDYGEKICPYIEEKVIEKEGIFQERGQAEALILICQMAVYGNIRRERTSEFVNEVIDSFSYDVLMNVLEIIQHFYGDSTVTSIFERFLSKCDKDYQTGIELLRMLCRQNKEATVKYLPYLNHIIFNTDSKDYSLFSMSYIMKGTAAGEYEAYDEDGNKFGIDEGVESCKMQAAVLYNLIDKRSTQINNFLKNLADSSAFPTHRAYIKNTLEDM